MEDEVGFQTKTWNRRRLKKILLEKEQQKELSVRIVSPNTVYFKIAYQSTASFANTHKTRSSS
jgi:hypothetical protein